MSTDISRVTPESRLVLPVDLGSMTAEAREAAARALEATANVLAFAKDSDRLAIIALLRESAVHTRTKGDPMTPEDLRTWRKQKGLSQAAVARLLHVTTTTVYRWEHNIHPMDDRTSALIRLLPSGTIAQQKNKKRKSVRRS